MRLIADFGELSGFNVNWNESVLMPLAPLSRPLPDSAVDILRVTEFQYLGIQVTPDPGQYIKLIWFLCSTNSGPNAWHGQKFHCRPLEGQI